MGLLQLLGLKPDVNFKEIYDNGAIIIDVRTQREYQQGNYKDSINIPLDQITNKITEIKKKNQIVIAVCKSGMRSGQATSILKQNEIEVYNGGSWTSLNSKLK